MSTVPSKNNSHSKWLTQAQIALGWAIVLLLLGSVGALYLGQAVNTALIGRNAQFLEYELEELRDQSALMEQEIAEAQSVTLLQDRAAEEGLAFVRPNPNEIEYVDITVYVPTSTQRASTQAQNSQEQPIVPARSMGDALLILVLDNVSQLFQGESSANR
jgi:hypothetical protein